MIRPAAGRCTSTRVCGKTARTLARKNIDALLAGGYDAIITNAAGCGSTLKEYGELLDSDSNYAGQCPRSSRFERQGHQRVPRFHRVEPRTSGSYPVTSRIRTPATSLTGRRSRRPRGRLLCSIPGLKFRELPLSDVCCGSAGIYNVVQPDNGLRTSGKEDVRYREDPCGDHRHGQPWLHAPTASRRPSPRHWATGGARGRDSRRGLSKTTPLTTGSNYLRNEPHQ